MKIRRGYLRILYLVLTLALFIPSIASPGMAANNMNGVKEGATVKVDKNSPTGYTATFVYKDPLADYVVFSGDFRFYKPEEKDLKKWYSPYQWEPGMLPAKTDRYEEKMTRIKGTDLWMISLPIPSGSFCYQYKVAYAFNGNDKDIDITIPDPANIAPLSNLERYPKEHSVVYGMFDKHKQITDNSILLPRKDAKVGQVHYVPYTDINGDSKYLGVYLPYGYDKNRKESYKVIYLSHGTGGDETEWFAFANAGNIMDHLIAEGKVEPAIVVAIDNNDYPPTASVLHTSDTPWDYQEGDISDNLWDYSMINRNFFNKVLPYVEENYNVSEESDDRAFAGLSRGGFLTSILYAENPTEFGYFGILSGVWKGLIEAGALDKYNELDAPKVILGYGEYDNVISQADIHAFHAKLKALGVDVAENPVFGAHDWFAWSQLFEDLVQDFVGK
ncbi:esterase family protein [Ammoniphilus sp. YIM 78166]|uniref:alpha/beta hydrolase n=1 Tax=Ammoniphilus sp. YIM 78166 TaxID=1644106 RepID=UPI00106F7161|nr:alpha/beta hydrolase-fold protein [Ammoniphilus sp. YIM 78166]